MVALALLGLGIATYLTIAHYAGFKVACTANGNPCETVQTSVYSEVASVPVALLGLIGYVLILGTLLAREDELTRLLTLAISLFGFGFSAYLTYREVYSIKAICEWCVTSAIIMTILFVLSIVRYLLAPPAARLAEPGPRRAAAAARRRRSRARSVAAARRARAASSSARRSRRRASRRRAARPLAVRHAHDQLGVGAPRKRAVHVAGVAAAEADVDIGDAQAELGVAEALDHARAARADQLRDGAAELDQLGVGEHHALDRLAAAGFDHRARDRVEAAPVEVAEAVDRDSGPSSQRWTTVGSAR